jgi:ABC-type enterobactin transport system permease subunit
VKSDTSQNWRHYLKEWKYLPAVAAITAVTTAAAITTIAAASTPATTATMSATAAAKPTAAAATTAALLLRTSFIHHQITPTEVLAVERVDRAIGFFVVVDFDESKTA